MNKENLFFVYYLKFGFLEHYSVVSTNFNFIFLCIFKCDVVALVEVTERHVRRLVIRLENCEHFLS